MKTWESLDAMRKHDLYRSRMDFEKLVNTGILSAAGSRTPFFEPVITKLLILLSDLLKAADQIGHRCTITEDVLCIDDTFKIKDLTDLIIRCRSASCHITSGNQIFETNKFKFNCVIGKAPSATYIDGKSIGSEYTDEITIIWGPMRLYLRRNMIRAYEHVTRLFPDPYDQPNPPTNFSNR